MNRSDRLEWKIQAVFLRVFLQYIASGFYPPDGQLPLSNQLLREAKSLFHQKFLIVEKRAEYSVVQVVLAETENQFPTRRVVNDRRSMGAGYLMRAGQSIGEQAYTRSVAILARRAEYHFHLYFPDQRSAK